MTANYASVYTKPSYTGNANYFNSVPNPLPLTFNWGTYYPQFFGYDRWWESQFNPRVLFTNIMNAFILFLYNILWQ